EALIRELIFEPLGMERATYFAEEAILAPTAAGHTVLDGTPYVQRPWTLPRTANAAGGAITSARELLRYARLWLRDGVSPGGERLLSAESLAQIGTPQFRQPADILTVGLTWILVDVNGVSTWIHTGGMPGQRSVLVLARDRDFAYCALTNAPEGQAA